MNISNEEKEKAILSISKLLDKKLKHLGDRAKQIELLLEQDVLPRLQNIESC